MDWRGVQCRSNWRHRVWIWWWWIITFSCSVWRFWRSFIGLRIIKLSQSWLLDCKCPIARMRHIVVGVLFLFFVVFLWHYCYHFRPIIKLLTIYVLIRNKYQTNNSILLKRRSGYHGVALGLIERIYNDPRRIRFLVEAIVNESCISTCVAIISLNSIILVVLCDKLEIIQFISLNYGWFIGVVWLSFDDAELGLHFDYELALNALDEACYHKEK